MAQIKYHAQKAPCLTLPASSTLGGGLPAGTTYKGMPVRRCVQGANPLLFREAIANSYIFPSILQRPPILPVHGAAQRPASHA